MDYKEELESGMVKDGISWTLWGTTRKTYPHLLPRFQTSKVILSLFESDTQVKILKSKLELATGPGISEFFGLPWLLKIKKSLLIFPLSYLCILLSLASAAEPPGLYLGSHTYFFQRRLLLSCLITMRSPSTLMLNLTLLAMTLGSWPELLLIAPQEPRTMPHVYLSLLYKAEIKTLMSFWFRQEP